MENPVTIRNLNELLLPHLTKDKVILKYTTQPLTSAGENYGSLMLKVEIKFSKNGSNAENTLQLVAKLCPPNEWIKQMFNVPVTFKREIAVYKTIIPTLKSFQQEQNVSNVISCFPDCYGARISLDSSSNTVDDDAALLLENLISSGYQVVDRMKGFDLETAKLIIKDLAMFHAIPIAIKLLKPNLFNTNILPYLEKMVAFESVSEEIQKAMFDTMIETSKLNPECIPLTAIIEEALKAGLNNMKARQPPREPFATINHNDYWVNNTMIKFTNGKPVGNKMVDFQLIDYGSPGNDIVFFLFSSVQKQVLDAYYDDLIRLYYDTFIKTLEDLKCDTTPFTFQLLQEEIDTAAKTSQFAHIMIMLRPIFAQKGTVKELSELTESDLITNDTISEEYKQKVPEMILHFIKRKWL